MGYNLYGSKEKKKLPFWLKIANVVFLAIFLCFMFFVFYLNVILEYHEVKGRSMYPTLNGDGVDEDYVYSSVTKDVARGDVIIYKVNDNGLEKLVIKRLLALGGDHIKVKSAGAENGLYLYEILVKINGVGEWQRPEYAYNQKCAKNFELYNNLYFTNVQLKDIKYDIDNDPYIIVPDNYFFAIGDNRDSGASNDCADYGAISTEYIIGKVEFVIYDNNLPIFQAIGQLFGGKKWK